MEQWSDTEVRFVLDLQDLRNKRSTDRHVALLLHIILNLSQPIVALTP